MIRRILTCVLMRIGIEGSDVNRVKAFVPEGDLITSPSMIASEILDI
jgi:hypothetical protein